jgi:hypothetical protein
VQTEEKAMEKNRASNTGGAGALLVGTIVFCAAIGLGLGALVGAPALLAIAGGAVGVLGGLRVVYGRFKDI